MTTAEARAKIAAMQPAIREGFRILRLRQRLLGMTREEVLRECAMSIGGRDQERTLGILRDYFGTSEPSEENDG